MRISNKLVARRVTRQLLGEIENLYEEVCRQVHNSCFRTATVPYDKASEPLKLVAALLLRESRIFSAVSERVTTEGNRVLDIDITPKGAQRILWVSEQISAKKQFLPQQVV